MFIPKGNTYIAPKAQESWLKRRQKECKSYRQWMSARNLYLLDIAGSCTSKHTVVTTACAQAKSRHGDGVGHPIPLLTMELLGEGGAVVSASVGLGESTILWWKTTYPRIFGQDKLNQEDAR